jgi:hypothetical protein
MTQRFSAYIHSIVGHQIMVSPNGSASEQYKCALDDFESIMPTAAGGPSGQFQFHVKKDRIGVEHYRQWLGLSKIENDRMANMEHALLELINLVRPGIPTQAEPGIDSPGEFADRFFGAKTVS